VVFLDFAVLGVLVGLALDGKLSALASVRIRRLPLAYAALALQVVAFPSERLPWSTPTSIARVLWLVSYLLQIALILSNVNLRGIELVGLGLACNLLAILANGGLMPVEPHALRAAGLAYRIHNNSISRAKPHLSWLVDRWAAPHALPLGNVFSVGDVLIALGLVVTIVVAMQPESRRVVFRGGLRGRLGLSRARPLPEVRAETLDVAGLQAEAAALAARFDVTLRELGLPARR